MSYQVAFKCKHYTAVSMESARHFTRYVRPGTRVEVIPNFLTDSVFAHSDLRVTPANQEFTFATVLQGFTRGKNSQCVLRAFQHVRKQHPRARLVMIGTDYEVNGPAYQWAGSNGLLEGVTFYGPLPRSGLLNYIAENVDAVVHPSLDEALSVTTMEAMALRKPVVAGRHTPGMKYLLDDGNVGMLVDVRKPKDVTQAMFDRNYKFSAVQYPCGGRVFASKEQF